MYETDPFPSTSGLKALARCTRSADQGGCLPLQTAYFGCVSLGQHIRTGVKQNAAGLV
jgi:hypothetical protein